MGYYRKRLTVKTCKGCPRKYTYRESRGHYCPECRSQRAKERMARESEDVLAKAESVLYPGVSYVRMTQDQRDSCIAWAKDYLIRSGKWPTKKEREKAA